MLVFSLVKELTLPFSVVSSILTVDNNVEEYFDT